MIGFLQLVVGGIAAGALTACMAVGVVLIHRTTGVLNLAQGGLAGLATYLVYAGTQDVPFAPAVLLAILGTAATGAVCGLVTARALTRASPVVATVATLAFALALDQVTQQAWGGTPLFLPAGLGVTPVHLGAVAISHPQAWGILIGVLVIGLLALALRLTRAGLAVRAVADQAEAARLVGIPAALVGLASWAVAGGLAAVAGVFIVESSGGVIEPGFLEPYLISALLAAVLGGLDNLWGTAVGGFLLSVATSLFVGYAPSIAVGTGLPLSGFSNTFIFVLLLAVLIVAPRGLLARRDRRRV